ncbi:MAG: tRNA (adenosine(37)-N6)-threonylcarbamoyltransferase complex dimerization subunit type 1 TsaB [Fibrobacter sp.]|nr:tRNA (adenosine(37)-N6)-threonylcarbamoyltransferase complex dimerization subunit type 1 TsaB [Fibrobacter sp.]
MRYVLGIDTSSIDMGVSLFKDDTPVASYSRFIKNSHAEHIHHAVDLLLRANNISPAEINNIAVTTGPGSFTGLRIGIAFAKGFAIGRETLRLLPVSSLEILAYAAHRSTRRIISAIDARNDEVFWASFKFTNRRIVRLTEDTVCGAEQFRAIIDDEDIVITDTMGFTKSVIFNFLSYHPRTFPVETYSLHRGYYCGLTGAMALDNQSVWKQCTEILPQYLRESSAKQRLQG